MTLDFTKINSALNKDESIFDSTITMPVLVASVSDIFKSFPNTENIDYQIKLIARYIQENPDDFNTKGRIYSSLSHSGILEKHLDVPEIKSIFEDFHSYICNLVDERIKAYESVPAENRVGKHDLVLQNYKDTKHLMESILPSGQDRTLNEMGGFLPEDLYLKPYQELKGMLNDPKIIQYLHADLLRHAISLNGINENLEEDVNKFLKSLKEFANSQVRQDALGVGVGCLTGDIVNAYYRFGTKFDNGTDLWGMVDRYDLKTIKDVKVEDKRSICCKEIEEKFPKAREMLYVYTQDGEFLFSPVIQKDKHIQHVMVAKGKPVLMAGMAYFDENNKLVAIDNSSGHYRPTIDRMKYLINDLTTENKDVLIFDHINKTEQSLRDFSKVNILFNLSSIRKNSQLEDSKLVSVSIPKP